MLGFATISEEALSAQPAPVAGDPYFSQVVLLLHGEGTNGSSTIVDSSSANRSPTIGFGGASSATISTTQKKYGGSSIRFNGGVPLAYANNAAFNIASVPFTIEGWVWLDAVGTDQDVFCKYGNSTSGWLVRVTPAAALQVFLQGDTSAILSATGIFTGAAWYHIAVSGQAGSIKAFVNGNQVGSTFAGTMNPDSTQPLVIGGLWSSGYFDKVNGYVDDFRFTVGTARYTANFTPPATQFPDLAPVAPTLSSFKNTLFPQATSSNKGTGTAFKNTAFPVAVVALRANATVFTNTLFPAKTAQPKVTLTGFKNTAFPTLHRSNAVATAFKNTFFPLQHKITLTQVLQEFSIYRGDNIEADFDSSYDIRGTIAINFTAPYYIGPQYPQVSIGFNISYALQIEMEFALTNSLQQSVASEFLIPYFTTGVVTRDFTVAYRTLAVDNVGCEFSVTYTHLSEDSTLIQYPEAFLQGFDFTVPLTECDLSCDEGSSMWEATCTLANVGDIRRFAFNDSFEVVLGGERFAFVVDSRAVDRTDPVTPKATLYGLSPLVWFQEPRAAKLSKTWTVATAASAIAEELIPGIEWSILDWMVPAGVFGVHDAAPLQALINLAAAAGALVESNPDGSVQVRYRHPVSVPQYSDEVASHFLSDRADNFSSQEKYSPNVLVDMLSVGDSQAGQATDRAEFTVDPDNEEQGIVRVYPSVWRTNVVARATGPVALHYAGVVTRTETETVEFKDGKASLRFPVVSITSVQWKTVNLGSLVLGDYSSSVQSTAGDGYSMAKVVYTTKAHEFRVAGHLGVEAQVVIEDGLPA